MVDVADLFRRAEVVPVVEPDRPYPGKPAQHPGAFGPVHAAQLGDPDGQFPVRVLPRFEDQRVVRAQARPQHQGVLAQPHRREHVVGEVAPVPGQFVHLAFTEHRRVDVLVAGPPLELMQVGLDLVAGGRAGRQPERQAGADQRIGVEDVKLAPELAMVDGHGSLLRRVRRPPGEHTNRPRADRPGPFGQLRKGSARTNAGTSRRRRHQPQKHARIVRRAGPAQRMVYGSTCGLFGQPCFACHAATAATADLFVPLRHASR